MLTYFYSQQNAFVFLNGKYLGIINQNVKMVDVEENSLLQFVCEDSSFTPFYAYNLKSKNLKVYNLKKGVLLCPTFEKNRNYHYKICFQKDITIKNSRHVLTLLLDGDIKFHINGQFYITSELPFIPNDIDVEEKDNFLFLSFKKEKTCLLIYRLENGEFNLRYKNVVDSYSYQNATLKIHRNYSSPYSLEITENWEYKDTFSLISTYSTNLNGITNHKKPLKNYLFIYLIIIGANVSSFVTQNIKSKLNSLKEFLCYPKSVLYNFEDNDDSVIILTSEGAKKVVFNYLDNLIDGILVDDY